MAKTPKMNIYGVKLTPELVTALRRCRDLSYGFHLNRVGRVATRDFDSLADVHDRFVLFQQLAVRKLAEFKLYVSSSYAQPWGYYEATDLGKRWLKKYDWMARRTF